MWVEIIIIVFTIFQVIGVFIDHLLLIKHFLKMLLLDLKTLFSARYFKVSLNPKRDLMRRGGREEEGQRE